MPKISAKGATITVGGSVAIYVKSYEIEWGQDVPEVTGFSDGWVNYIPGMPIVGVTMDVLWDKTAGTGTFAVFKGLMTTPAAVVLTPEAAGPALSGTFLCDGIHPGGAAASGAISLGSIHLSPSGTTIATFA